MQRLRGAQVYLDSNIFIALAEGMASVQSLLVELLDGAYEELLGGREGLRTHAVDRDILRKASALAAESNMKLPDAIHTATAKHCSCQFLITEDKRLRSVDLLQVLRLADLVTAAPPSAETP